MKVQPVRDPLEGELALEIQPALRPAVDAGWRRRLNYAGGRSLSHLAFEAEQEGRAGAVALLAQGAAPGVVAGLEVFRAEGDRIAISPGLGLTASGEDVSLPRSLEVALGELPLELGGAVTSIDVALAQGRTFAPLLALVLRPALLELHGEDDGDPCLPADADRAFEDRLRLDAARLALVPWPADLGLPPPQGAAWRNEVAQAVFRDEPARGRLGPLGLGAHALPLALLGLELSPAAAPPTWRLAFLDRAALRRIGGGRSSALLPGLRVGSAALLRARVDQLLEQVADIRRELGPQSDGEQLLARLRTELRWLPPVGFLPKEVLDLAARRSPFFDDELNLDVVPAPLEQLDALTRASISLAPIDLRVGDRVRLVVPVPQAVYDPQLLQEPKIDPEFLRLLAELDVERRAWLTRRGEYRSAVGGLAQLADGEDISYPRPDPDAVGELPTHGGLRLATGSADALRARLLSPELAVSPPAKEFELATQAAFAELEAELVTYGVWPERGGSLPAAIRRLEELIARSRDRVETGFVRAAGELYRSRQHLLGNQAATRMATSPILGHVTEGLQERATRHDLRDYYTSVNVRRTEPDATAAAAAARKAAGTAEMFTVTLSKAGYEAGKNVRADVLEAMVGSELVFDPKLEIPGFQKGDDRTEATKTFAEVRKGLTDLVGQIRAGHHDRFTLESTLRDEAEEFRASTRALDATLSILRTWEARIRDYEELLARARKARAALQSLRAKAEHALAQVEAELSEARHDLRVALALLEEERRRVAELAERRRSILAGHFQHVFFYRPRSLEAGALDLLVRTLLPGHPSTELLDCADESGEAPADVARMVELWQEAPLGWFPALRPLLKAYPQRKGLLELLQFAQVRAQTFQVAPPKPKTEPAQLSLFSLTAAAALITFQGQSLAAERAQALRIDPVLLAGMAWSDVRVEAERVVSIGDLLAGVHGSPSARKQASAFLEQVQGAAACLHRAVGLLPAAVRLEWTRRVSEHDRVGDLRSLSRLPGWERISEELLRRRLQDLVDGLYGRVDPAQPRAVALVTDLVRIAILAASHAPTAALISGRLRAPTQVVLGGLVPVVPTAPQRTDVGMAVNFFDGALLLARGVVADALGDELIVRVLEIPKPPPQNPAGPVSNPLLELDLSTQVQFLSAEYLAPKAYAAQAEAAVGHFLGAGAARMLR